MKVAALSAFALVQYASSVLVPVPVTKNFQLEVVHLNDFHAKIEGYTSSDSECSNINATAAADLCDGSWPRIFTAAKKFVDAAEAEGRSVVFVDAGDEFMGSIWSSFYKGKEAAEFLNLLCSPRAEGGAGFLTCLGTFGNHEFDYGYDVLVNYTSSLDSSKLSFLSTNVVDECEGSKLSNSYTTHKIVDVGGVKVAFVAYTTPETLSISSAPECVKINDEATSIQAEIDKIKTSDSSVNIFVAIAHSGYQEDLEIARAVPDVDIVIGAHSHTFLWTESSLGPNPTLSAQAFGANVTTKIMGDYPSISQNSTTPVVQAFWAGRYLGHFIAEFDVDGVLASFLPSPVLLGNAKSGSLAKKEFQFELDATALELLYTLEKPVEAFSDSVIGVAKVPLEGSRSLIRNGETNLGNFVCDAMLDNLLLNKNFVEDFGKPDFCLMNSGGIRQTIQEGDVKVKDVIAVLPFGNVISVLEMTGEELYLMAEHGVSRAGASKGEFPQIGGFQIVYNSTVAPACGSGTATACVKGSNIKVSRVIALFAEGKMIPNDASKTYKLVTNDFLTRGGDSYVVLSQAKNLFPTGDVIDEVVREKFVAAGATGVAPVEDCRILNKANPSAVCKVKTSKPTAVPTSAPTFAPTFAPTKKNETKTPEPTFQQQPSSATSVVTAVHLLAMTVAARFMF